VAFIERWTLWRGGLYREVDFMERRTPWRGGLYREMDSIKMWNL
jgi:hypothetical protein